MNDGHSGAIKAAVITGVFGLLTALIVVLLPPLLDDDDNDANGNASVAADVRSESIATVAAAVTSPTSTAPPTDTPEPTLAVPPTSTPVPMPTALPTSTPQPTTTPLPTATNTPSPTPTATPTPPPAGTVLYQADETGGFETWDLSGGWLFFESMLVNDGTGGTVIAPYDLDGLTGVAVEVEIQVVKCACENDSRYGGEPLFGINARDGAVQGVVQDSLGTVYSGAVLQLEGEGLAGAAFEPGRNWHTYRLEIEGNTTRFVIDNAVLVEATDLRLISSSDGNTGLFCADIVQIAVRSFKVISL